MLTILLFLATCFLAYSNGANDNFKGVASLFGGKITPFYDFPAAESATPEAFD